MSVPPAPGSNTMEDEPVNLNWISKLVVLGLMITSVARDWSARINVRSLLPSTASEPE